MAQAATDGDRFLSRYKSLNSGVAMLTYRNVQALKQATREQMPRCIRDAFSALKFWHSRKAIQSWVEEFSPEDLAERVSRKQRRNSLLFAATLIAFSFAINPFAWRAMGNVNTWVVEQGWF